MPRCWSACPGPSSRLPGGFLPVDDQGFITTDVQTPSDSSYRPHRGRGREGREISAAARRASRTSRFLTGFSFSGQGMNTAQAFITLKDWSERGPKDSAARDRRRHQPRSVASIRDAKISALQPPPIDNLGNSSGFSFRLQDRGQKGYPALMRAADQLIAEANASPVLQKVYVEGLPPTRRRSISMIDRDKAGAFGVTFEDINNTISTNLGSNYINDFPNRGRMQRVIVQADRAEPHERRRPPQLQRQEQPRPAGAVLVLRHGRMGDGPDADRRLQLLSGGAHLAARRKPGYTSGDAIAEMERLAGKLPRGFGYEWTGQSLQEKLSGSQAPFLLGALGAAWCSCVSPRSTKAGPFRSRCC